MASASKLRRELGRTDSNDNKSIVWSRGLRKRVLFTRAEKALPMQYTQFVYVENLRATVFGSKARDGVTRFTEMKERSSSTMALCDTSGQWHIPEGEDAEIYYMKISSMSLSPSGGGILITMVGGGLPACRVELNNSDAAAHAGVFTSTEVLTGIFPQDPGVSYLASAANPYSGTTKFAVAASNGALTLEESQGDWGFRRGERYYDAPAVMAVDWLSRDVIIKGCGDGGVRLWDLRSREDSRGMRIQHPSRINYARQIIDEHTIIVAGLESQLCTYDMRYISHELATPGQVTKPSNQPHQFSSYENLDLNHLAAGFDVHGNLAAAATDHGHVIIWDVKGGFKVRQEEWNNATCLRFVDEENEGKALRLMGTAGESVIELGW